MKVVLNYLGNTDEVHVAATFEDGTEVTFQQTRGYDLDLFVEILRAFVIDAGGGTDTTTTVDTR